MNNRDDVLLEMIQDCASIIEICSKIKFKNKDINYWDKNSLSEKIAFMLLAVQKLHKEGLIDDQYLLEIVTRGDE